MLQEIVVAFATGSLEDLGNHTETCIAFGRLLQERLDLFLRRRLADMDARFLALLVRGPLGTGRNEAAFGLVRVDLFCFATECLDEVALACAGFNADEICSVFASPRQESVYVVLPPYRYV
jgi:hypothetical protein